jgi:perosamine synthetase
MERRFRRFDPERWRRHAEKGQRLTRRLERAVLCPGTASTPHNYWVFPLFVEEPSRLIRQLVCSGYDATQGASMCAVPPPPDRPEQRAVWAEEFLKKVVFLPFYPEMSDRAARRMADVVLEALGPRLLPEGSALAAAKPACKCSQTVM